MANFWEDWNNEAQAGAQAGVQSWDAFDQKQKRQALIKKMQEKNAAAPKKGNFLTDLIPTAGGIGGTLAGAAGGAAIGSVVPVIGTAIGGLIGGVLGGAGGSALGKVGENAVEGNNLGDGVAGEALLGGLTSTPIGAGFKLARAGLKTATGIGKRAAGDLVQEAGMATIGKGTARRLGMSSTAAPTGIAPSIVQGQGANTFSLGSKLTSMGDKALASQYGVLSKPTIRQTNPAKLVSNLADYGITKPADAERIASAITGSNGILTKQVSKAVDAAGGVDTSSLRRVFNDALDNNGVVDTQRKSLTKMFEAQMGRLSGGSLGSINPKANATESLAVMKQLEKRIAEFKGKGGTYHMPTSTDGQQASVLQLVRDELGSSLEVAGANRNIGSLMTPQVREQLVALHPNNAKWAQHVDNNIMSAKDFGSLRSAQKPFVDINNVIKEGADNAFSAGGRMVNSTNGIRSAITDGIVNLAKTPAMNAVGRGLRATGKAVSPGGISGAAKPVGQGLVGLTARQGGARLLTADAPIQDPTQQLDANGLTQADYGTLMDSGYDGSSNGVPGLNDSPSGTNDSWSANDPTAINPPPTNPFGVSLQDVATQMRTALQNGDPKGYTTLSDMYDRIAEYEKNNSQTPDMSAATQQSLATSSNAIGTLDQLEGLYQATGNGSGKIGGAVQNFLGGVGMDNNASSYNALAESSTSQLAKAINGSGQVSDADAAALVKALPLITDNPQVAAAKFASLRQRLATSQQNSMRFSSGGTDLASILSGLGQ